MSINYFDEIFFSNYIKEDDEVLDVCHKHVVTILDTIVIWLFFFVIIPTFFYYNDSFHLKSLAPFFYFEIYLFLVYIVLIYKIFDWYNDVWIITEKWIIDLDWEIMKKNIVYIDYNDIRWIELDQKSNWDWILGKWEIRIHLEWEWNVFALEEAKSPWEIVKYIQWVLEDKEKLKKDKAKNLDDKLISTIKSVIKDHLERKWYYDEDWIEIEDGEEKEIEDKIQKVLHKKWTVDLRNIK